MKRFISATLSITLVLISLAGCVKKEQSTEKAAMYTQSYSITKPMLTYCFNAQYLSFVTANQQQLETYGLDTTQPLDKQTCALNNANWYDYFMDIAKNRLEQCLIIAEKAKAENKTLSDEDEKSIQSELQTLKVTAKEKKLNLDDYLEDTFGEGVNSEVVTSVTRMERMVSKYYEKYEKKMDTGAEAVEKYYDGHKRLYSTVDYLCFYISPLGDSMQESTSARRTAMDLSEAEDSEEFLELVGEYVTAYYTDYYGVELSKKEIKGKVEEAQLSCQVTGAGYDSTSAASRWAFSDDRVENEGTYIEDTENGGYYVYFLTSLPSREEYKAVSIRQIVYDINDFTSQDDAMMAAQEAILNLEINNYSKEYFKKLAETESADTLSKATGGLYENLTKGNLVDAKELEEWIFSEDRSEGDITLLQTDTYGYHVVYIEKIGDPVWMLRSREGMVASRFGEYVSDLGDEHVVYINDNIVYSVSEAEIPQE